MAGDSEDVHRRGCASSRLSPDQDRSARVIELECGRRIAIANKNAEQFEIRSDRPIFFQKPRPDDVPCEHRATESPDLEHVVLQVSLFEDPRNYLRLRIRFAIY